MQHNYLILQTLKHLGLNTITDNVFVLTSFKPNYEIVSIYLSSRWITINSNPVYAVQFLFFFLNNRVGINDLSDPG